MLLPLFVTRLRRVIPRRTVCCVELSGMLRHAVRPAVEATTARLTHGTVSEFAPLNRGELAGARHEARRPTVENGHRDDELDERHAAAEEGQRRPETELFLWAHRPYAVAEFGDAERILDSTRMNESVDAL